MNIVNKVQDAVKAMRGLGTAFEKFSDSVPKKADKPGDIVKKKKTKKGAMHKVNPIFHGRKILSLTHSKYRRAHKGLVKKTPNYKLPHPAPKWRNRWTLQ